MNEEKTLGTAQEPVPTQPIELNPVDGEPIYHADEEE